MRGMSAKMQTTIGKALSSIENRDKKVMQIWRGEGCKAAHPNDGWVDRENNKIRFMYPYFIDDDFKNGDTFAIAFTGDKSYKICTIKNLRKGFDSIQGDFEIIKECDFKLKTE